MSNPTKKWQRAQAKIRREPVKAAKELLGVDLWMRQEEILSSIFNKRYTAVKSCHGIGKTHLAATASILFLMGHYPAVVVTTAPTGNQVKNQLWKYLRAIVQKAGITGDEPGILHWELKPDWYAIGFSSDRMPNMQGYHSENMLIIPDEACGIEVDKINALESLMSSGRCHLFAPGNPDTRASEFFKMFQSRLYNCFTVSAFDTPNFTTFGITLDDIRDNTWREKIISPLPRPYLINPQWVYERYERWGENSPLFAAKVMAQFPDKSEDIAFPEAWIRRALQRARDNTGIHRVICDPARSGNDLATIGSLRGNEFVLDAEYPTSKTTDLSGRSVAIAREIGATELIVDETGVGGGVVDESMESFQHSVIGVNFGGAGGECSIDGQLCHDTRSLMMWELRYALKDWLSIPDDQRLLSELEDIRFNYDARGIVRLEKKDLIKNRLGHSPNWLDTLMMAVSGAMVSGGGWSEAGDALEEMFEFGGAFESASEIRV